MRNGHATGGNATEHTSTELASIPVLRARDNVHIGVEVDNEGHRVTLGCGDTEPIEIDLDAAIALAQAIVQARYYKSSPRRALDSAG